MLPDRTCRFFITRKKRFCKLTVKVGRKFCGEHLMFESNDEANSINDTRIKCPYDPTHSCYVYKLQKHLEICNSKPSETLPPYIKDKSFEKEEKKILSLQSTPFDQIQFVIKKITNIFMNINYYIPVENLQICLDDLDLSSSGPSTKKHLIQISSLLGHLTQLHLIDNNYCFIEFGAGRGKLSFYLSRLLKSKLFINCCGILIDKANCRHKFDNKLKYSSNLEPIRIRANIADFILQNVPNISHYSKRIGLSKHLCGSATDMAIKCIIEADQSEAPCKIDGIIFAPCCHFKCDWNNYVANEFLVANGITSEDFQIMTGIASWATCGFHLKEKPSEEEPADDNVNLNLSSDEKKDIGKMCKFLIDYGRMKVLENNGYKCKIVYYVDEEVTLENVCLIATKIC